MKESSTTTTFPFGKKIMAAYETRQTPTSGQDIYDATSETLYYVVTEEIDQSRFDSALSGFRNYALDLQNLSIPISSDANCDILKTFTGGYKLCIFDEQDNLIYQEKNLYGNIDANATPHDSNTTTFAPFYDETTTSSILDVYDTHDNERLSMFTTNELYELYYDNNGENYDSAYVGMLIYKGELPPYTMAIGTIPLIIDSAASGCWPLAAAAAGAGITLWLIGECVSPSECYYYTFTSLTVKCNGVMQGLYGYSDASAHGPYNSIEAAQSQMEAAITTATIPSIYKNQFRESDQLVWYFNGVITDSSNHIVRRFEQPQN